MNKHIVVLVVIALASACTKQLPHDLAIKNVTVIDMTGQDPFQANIIINDGRITSITPSHDNNPARNQIDGTGKFLIPGLIDSHVHLASFEEHPQGLDELLDAGVTTARDMGAIPETTTIWRDEIENGKRRGPELLIVGQILNGEIETTENSGSLPFHRIIETPEQAEAAIAEMKALGAIQIKVHNSLSSEVFKTILEVAAARTLRVVGHIPPGPSPLWACENGMAEIAHASALLESVFWRDNDPAPNIIAGITELTGEKSSPLYQCMADRNMVFAPNLSMYIPILANLPEEQAAMTERLVNKYGEIALLAKNSGVRIIASTDSNGADRQVTTGKGLHLELQMLVTAGFTPMEALLTATVNPAAHFQMGADIGTIEVGKEADLVLLCANPLEDISNTAAISQVYANGELAHQTSNCEASAEGT